MKKLFLGALALLAPLALANTAHAIGTFGLFTNAGCFKCGCKCDCYPQTNAFTPACCGYVAVPCPTTYAPAAVDGAGAFGLFGCGKIGCEKTPHWKGYKGHKKGAPGCPDCPGGYAPGSAGYAGDEGGYEASEGGYEMGGYAQEGTVIGGPGVVVGQNPLGLNPGEELVGDVTVDGQVVAPGTLAFPGRAMLPQAPAIIPGTSPFPTPTQQFVPAPAARPMMAPASMNYPYGAYPALQQVGYAPSYAPSYALSYAPTYAPVQPSYNPYYQVPQYGYPYYNMQQQVPYYWSTPGGR